jgi:hypothetical protein
MEKYLQISRRSQRLGAKTQANQGFGFVTAANFYLTAEKGLPYTPCIPHFGAPVFTHFYQEPLAAPGASRAWGKSAVSDLALPP